MPVGQYPFIDVAVHRQVRSRFARGEALVLFAPDLGHVLWANGRGAELFGFETPYELMDEWQSAPASLRRQLQTVARQFGTGEGEKTVSLRISAGLRSRRLTLSLIGLRLIDGTPALLLADGAGGDELDLPTRAGRIVAGLGETGTQVAVLDAAAEVLAVSPATGAPDLDLPLRQSLIGQIAAGDNRLVKRRVAAGGRRVAVALARLSDEPALYLLFVVETDGDAEAAPAREDAAAPVPAGEEAAAPAGPPSGAASDFEFVFDAAAKPVRFAWNMDTESRFSRISPDFAAAVGPNAADVIERRFEDVARVFGFDRDNEIANLLERRDTWSGKTVSWPVQGTRLSVPVDLAALPTYDRHREFRGFRGFGIVRLADAHEDPEAIGLSLTVPAPAAEAAAPETPAPTGPGAPDVMPAGEAEDEARPAGDGRAQGEPVTTFVPEAADADGEDPFQGETPALKIVKPFGRRENDKVIDLDQRRPRARENLSTGEQQAFREIGERLARTFGREAGDEETLAETKGAQTRRARKEAGSPDGAQAGEAAPAVPQDAGRPAEAAETASVEVPPLAGPQLPSAFATAGADRTPARFSASLVDDLPIAILLHDGHVIHHANPEFLELTGYRDLAALTEAGGLAGLFAAPELADDMSAEKLAGTLRLVRADDSELAVHARLKAVRWDDGRALMLSVVPAGEAAGADAPSPQRDGRDAAKLPASRLAGTPLTPDDARVAALKIEVEELRSILETATDGVVILGEHGDVRSMNRSASALFDYDESEIRGQPFAKLFAHESQRAVMDYLNGLTEHGVASVLNDGREVIGREASGGFLPLFMTIGRLTGSNGYCAVMRDITQWKRTEEELRAAKLAAEQANSHKSAFLARVSHEIRTPLNAIIGFADMMAEERFGAVGNPRYLEYARDIGRSGKHVLDIVNDLLDISKIEAGEMDVSFAAVALNDTIAEAVSLLQPQANNQRVIIRTSLSSSVPEIVADSRSIKQIALNLLSNAIRFTPAGGQIVVSTAYEANGAVVLRIRDTGVGMSHGELDQAMKPFRQVKGASRPRGDGTGLGLPLTKAMVEANRAQFEIRSAPNEGTLIEISFPSQRVLAD